MDPIQAVSSLGSSFRHGNGKMSSFASHKNNQQENLT